MSDSRNALPREERALPSAQMSWRPLRDDEYSSMVLPITLRRTPALYGVAIDLGMSRIGLTLWNLAEGRRLAGRVGYSRTAQDSGGMIQTAIAEALADIAAQASIHLPDIGKVLVVGSAGMTNLLIGKNHTQSPQPEKRMSHIERQSADTALLREAWGIDGEAAIRFVAPVGGLIGSGLLAGVIATRLIEQPAGSLLIDFGINSGLALWDGQTLHMTSIAGGAVFEGSGISDGMPGEDGAIYRVRQDEGDGFAIGVQGKTAPLGVCGSGLVDAVAWMRRNGRLDKAGKFTDGDGFVLYDGERRIALKRADIEALQLAKAAIGGGVHWLCRQAGLPLEKLHKVFVSGAFGHLLDVDNARQIGLLPPVSHMAFRLESNTALVGCEMLLLSTEGARTLETVLALGKVYSLPENAAFVALIAENLTLHSMRESDSAAVKAETGGFAFCPLPILGENGSC